MIDLFLTKLRRFVGNRRLHRRRKADLLLAAAVVIGNPAAVNPRKTGSLAGLTRDLSVSHLAINVPTNRIAGHFLTAPDSRLLITLDLPKGQVEFQATAVRYEKIGEGIDGKGYLIVLKIVRMKEAARAAYTEYLRTSG